MRKTWNWSENIGRCTRRWLLMIKFTIAFNEKIQAYSVAPVNMQKLRKDFCFCFVYSIFLGSKKRAWRFFWIQLYTGRHWKCIIKLFADFLLKNITVKEVVKSHRLTCLKQNWSHFSNCLTFQSVLNSSFLANLKAIHAWN